MLHNRERSEAGQLLSPWLFNMTMDEIIEEIRGNNTDLKLMQLILKIGDIMRKKYKTLSINGMSK